ncbi:hypothetical protein ACUOFC_69080, partial [Escherichia sp. TWPC-MK]
QMNRALGMFEAQSKLWRLASLAQSSGAPVTKWATREEREGQLPEFALRLEHPQRAVHLQNQPMQTHN